uniref:Uncharacterized protein n=1 Tax=Physcomitrium patens TaxID=3218 RepID=A0A2K1JBK2_PHYPA|nr:hypothetical protein PHYPA_019165 [Physcomitrium patens]
MPSPRGAHQTGWYSIVSRQNSDGWPCENVGSHGRGGDARSGPVAVENQSVCVPPDGRISNLRSPSWARPLGPHFRKLGASFGGALPCC